MTLHGMSDGLAHLFTPKVIQHDYVDWFQFKSTWLMSLILPIIRTVGEVSWSGRLAGGRNANLLFPGFGIWRINRLFVLQSGQQSLLSRRCLGFADQFLHFNVRGRCHFFRHWSVSSAPNVKSRLLNNKLDFGRIQSADDVRKLSWEPESDTRPSVWPDSVRSGRIGRRYDRSWRTRFELCAGRDARLRFATRAGQCNQVEGFNHSDAGVVIVVNCRRPRVLDWLLSSALRPSTSSRWRRCGPSSFSWCYSPWVSIRSLAHSRASSHPSSTWRSSHASEKKYLRVSFHSDFNPSDVNDNHFSTHFQSSQLLIIDQKVWLIYLLCFSFFFIFFGVNR